MSKKAGAISRREIAPAFLLIVLFEACSPEDFHNAVIRLFEAFVQVGVLDGESGETCEDGHKLNIVFVECAQFASIDAQDADGIATDFQGNAQDGYDAFIFGRIFVLEAFIGAYIGDKDRCAAKCLAVNQAVIDINRSFRQIASAQSIDSGDL